jgi:hypothetical protein
MASYNLQEILNSKYKTSKFGLLGSLGTLLEPNTKLYVYPACDDATNEIKTIESMTVPTELTFLLKYLVDNKYIENITDFNPDVVSIWSRKILNMIQQGTEGWEKFVPPSVAKTVKTKCLFGAKCDL